MRTGSPSCCAMQCRMASLSGHQGYDSVAAVAIWIGVNACAGQPNSSAYACTMLRFALRHLAVLRAGRRADA